MKKFTFACLFLLGLNAHATIQFSPGRIRQVALVIADPGAARESSHGHSALRISTANTFGDKDIIVNYGADLPRDANNEIVPTNTLVNSLRGIGLTKHYPSQVNTSYYYEFKTNYKTESRGVWTHTLDPAQFDVVKLSAYVNAQLAAGHARRPFQILNYNCAVMVVEALNQALYTPVLAHGTNMPDNLEQIFKARGLILKSTYDAVN